MKCALCGKVFKATRATAKYCGSKCRKLAFLIVPSVSVPENVTDNALVELPSGENVSLSVPDKNIPNNGLSTKMLDNTGFDSRKLDSNDKPSWLCRYKDCWLEFAPGQDKQCIYHWRISECMPHISPTSYKHLNIERKRALQAITGTIIDK